MESLLKKYSEYLEEHGYMDTDWREEEPTAIELFIKEYGEDVGSEIIANVLCNCRAEDGKIIYNTNN